MKSNWSKLLLIKACLNGSREVGEHPAIPFTAAELARDAALVVAAGAGALHIHPRNTAGKQSLRAEDQAAALQAIRARCVEIPVGISTGNWIEPDETQRLQRVQEWTLLPDFASVNFNEAGAEGLCHALLARQIGVEIGISTCAEIELLARTGLADRCLRILIEPEEEVAEAALASSLQLIEALDQAHIQLPRLLHGFGAASWAVIDLALARGYDTRIGLEDTLTLPGGRLTLGNAELVELVQYKVAQK